MPFYVTKVYIKITGIPAKELGEGSVVKESFTTAWSEKERIATVSSCGTAALGAVALLWKVTFLKFAS